MITINKYVWAKESDEVRKKILHRAGTDISQLVSVVQPICEAVKTRGDDALVEFTAKFDNAVIKKNQIAVTPAEFEEARTSLDDKAKEVIRYASGNIWRFHETQKVEPIWMMEVDKGVIAGEKTTPITDVALYIPRGRGSFPSVLLMLGNPAVVAGVPRIIVITPPNEQGKIDPAILFAADLLGIKEIYKVGGAQAIAAVAYGTETVPKCSKVIGPGNAYVTAAKRYLMGAIDPGVPAGPSESIILTDEFADPHKAALDMMIEAEHGSDSVALLVTHSEQVANAVEQHLQHLVETIKSDQRRKFVTDVYKTYGGIVITANLNESINFVNDYAPEHMEVMVRDPFGALQKINNAGEILLGDCTPITMCNFLMGPNAILPTGQNAKTSSSVSIHDFQKRSSIGYVTAEGFERVRDFAASFADIEGFETHAKAVRER